MAYHRPGAEHYLCVISSNPTTTPSHTVSPGLQRKLITEVTFPGVTRLPYWEGWDVNPGVSSSYGAATAVSLGGEDPSKQDGNRDIALPVPRQVPRIPTRIRLVGPGGARARAGQLRPHWLLCCRLGGKRPGALWREHSPREVRSS